jgi:hypothetical protein
MSIEEAVMSERDDETLPVPVPDPDAEAKADEDQQDGEPGADGKIHRNAEGLEVSTEDT